jgi:hypothetical protein
MYPPPFAAIRAIERAVNDQHTATLIFHVA